MSQVRPVLGPSGIMGRWLLNLIIWYLHQEALLENPACPGEDSCSTFYVWHSFFHLETQEPDRWCFLFSKQGLKTFIAKSEFIEVARRERNRRTKYTLSFFCLLLFEKVTQIRKVTISSHHSHQFGCKRASSNFTPGLEEAVLTLGTCWWTNLSLILPKIGGWRSAPFRHLNERKDPLPVVVWESRSCDTWLLLKDLSRY